MEPWIARLEAGDADGAWDAFVERYRRLIFAAIRHYTTDPDDVMDVFARVCEALRSDDLARLRQYAAEPAHRARFSTWLMVVVRNLTIDWFRHRDGRPDSRPPWRGSRLPSGASSSTCSSKATRTSPPTNCFALRTGSTYRSGRSSAS